MWISGRCVQQVPERKQAHAALKNHPLKQPEAGKKKKVIFGNMSGIRTARSLSEETSSSINILLKNQHVRGKLLWDQGGLWRDLAEEKHLRLKDNPILPHNQKNKNKINK